MLMANIIKKAIGLTKVLSVPQWRNEKIALGFDVEQLNSCNSLQNSSKQTSVVPLTIIAIEELNNMKSLCWYGAKKGRERW